MKNCNETAKTDDKLAKHKRNAKVKWRNKLTTALKCVLNVALALLKEMWWLNKEIV